MPVDVRVSADGRAPDGSAEACVRIRPTTRWTGTGVEAGPGDVAVDRDYYVLVRRTGAAKPNPAAGVCEAAT
jgi:hypothetical protein